MGYLCSPCFLQGHVTFLALLPRHALACLNSQHMPSKWYPSRLHELDSGALQACNQEVSLPSVGLAAPYRLLLAALCNQLNSAQAPQAVWCVVVGAPQRQLSGALTADVPPCCSSSGHWQLEAHSVAHVATPLAHCRSGGQRATQRACARRVQVQANLPTPRIQPRSR